MDVSRWFFLSWLDLFDVFDVFDVFDAFDAFDMCDVFGVSTCLFFSVLLLCVRTRKEEKIFNDCCCCFQTTHISSHAQVSFYLFIFFLPGWTQFWTGLEKHHWATADVCITTSAWRYATDE